jgi:hypothetical protein
MAGYLQTMMEQNKAPGWFFLDRAKGLPDMEIIEKIRLEVFNDVINRGYDMNLWTEDFISRVAGAYFLFFNKLFIESPNPIYS